MSEISDDLKDFIELCIPSIPFLEAVLLMHRDRIQTWDSDELALQLNVDEATAARLLCELHRAEVLVPCTTFPCAFHYEPLSGMFCSRMDQLADLYPHKFVEIRRLIHYRSPQRQAARHANPEIRIAFNDRCERAC